jgi:antitoxin VapB
VTEAERKRQVALDAAGPFQTHDPADIRWLLCGRGRPVSAGSSPYAVRVTPTEATVLYEDIEASRVAADERWEELGYTPVAHPWYVPAPQGPPQPDLARLRRDLVPEELERYRAAGTAVAQAFVATLPELTPERSELHAIADLARRLVAVGFTTPVLLAGGEERAPLHRHPLPTNAPLGRFALLATTAERDGLYVSMTRIVAFGRPPDTLREAVAAAARVDAAILAASRPGRTLGELFEVLTVAYADAGVRDEWRRHHQGGVTGYAGREVFATPGDETPLPGACAVAWNPSLTGGGKSEDTALVSKDGIEVITRTPELPELEVGGGTARPAIVEL